MPTRPTAEQVAGWLSDPRRALVHYLRALATASDRPLVLLFDEADVLEGDAMVSFLTQLREV